jgi:hypothetical protein|tara:strand:- start:7774 stop:8013 length:240 start_codon:yes stop_codon:yes gene_type:complete
MQRQIELTNDELGAFAVIEGKVKECQQALAGAVRARIAYLELIELKYKAKFDPESGFLLPLEPERPEDNGKKPEEVKTP